MRSPMIVAATYITEAEKNLYSHMQVLRSAAGWYVGTIYNDSEPGTRDSLGYFSTMAQAEQHLQEIISGDAETRDHP